MLLLEMPLAFFSVLIAVSNSKGDKGVSCCLPKEGKHGFISTDCREHRHNPFERREPQGRLDAGGVLPSMGLLCSQK